MSFNGKFVGKSEGGGKRLGNGGTLGGWVEGLYGNGLRGVRVRERIGEHDRYYCKRSNEQRGVICGDGDGGGGGVGFGG